jgi:hypothetical protein
VGIEIDRERFDEADYPRFTERLEHCLEALEQLLERPGFGVGPRTIGAELELFLVDEDGHPLAKNQAVLEDAGDPRLTLELDRFNLEVNPSPSTLAGQPLTALGQQLEAALTSLDGAGPADAALLAAVERQENRQVEEQAGQGEADQRDQDRRGLAQDDLADDVVAGPDDHRDQQPDQRQPGAGPGRRRHELRVAHRAGSGQAGRRG